MADIDVLKLVFDADASAMAKGVDQARKGTDDLNKSILQVDKEAQQLGDSFLGMVNDAKGAIAGLVGISTITAGILDEAARVDALGKFSEAIGANIEDVDAWGQAVARHGGSAESFQGTIKGLTDSMTELVLTGGGPASAALARLGISATDAGGNIKSAFDLLPDIADSFERMSRQESVALGQMLGLDQGTILLLQQGRAQVDDVIRQQKALGVATREDAESAKQFNQAWQDTRQVFGSVFRDIGVIVLPILTDMLGGVQSFVDFLRDHQGFVEGVFIGLAAVLSTVLLPALTAALFNPITWIGLAIAAFATLYEDIQNFLNGNESLIGEISKKYPIVGKIVKGLADVFSSLFDTIKAFDLSEFFSKAIDAVVADFEKFKQEIQAIKDLFSFDDAEAPALIESRGGGHTQEDIPPALRNQAILGAANNPLTVAGGNTFNTATSTQNRNTAVNVGGVTVNAPGADARQVAGGIIGELKNQIRQVVSNFDDGIMG